uniref:Uncharacterized protein n=1 Tax=Trypanosoma congolense (strain IL3000) TaxID=1068625 RepID=G0UXA7_TRYCI|nr:conserved hypothetical protein [Trypanosoma congolense IL3000]
MSEESLTFAQVAAGVTSNKAKLCCLKGELPNSSPSTDAAPPGVFPSVPRQSYVDAVMASSVKLDGVCVDTSGTDCRGSVTNSTIHEQESVLSSWADDDECFFESVQNAIGRNVAMCNVKEASSSGKPYSTSAHGIANSVNGRVGSTFGEEGGNSRRGRGNSRWRFVGGPETNTNRNGNNRMRRGNCNNFFCSNRTGCVEGLKGTGGRFSDLR